MNKKSKRPKYRKQQQAKGRVVSVEKRETSTASMTGVTTALADARPGMGNGTLQQQRAAFALQRVQAWADRDTEEQKKLNSYAAKMPFMVHANGLGQTTAFYRAKKDTDPHRELYRLLGDWLTRPGQPFAGQNDLLDGVTTADLHTYMAAQAEAMLFLGWVKQFADAFLKSE